MAASGENRVLLSYEKRKNVREITVKSGKLDTQKGVTLYSYLYRVVQWGI